MTVVVANFKIIKNRTRELSLLYVCDRFVFAIGSQNLDKKYGGTNYVTESKNYLLSRNEN